MKFEVGKTYKNKNFADGIWFKVLAVGNEKFFAVNYVGDEFSRPLNDPDWIDYEESKPPQKPSERINEIFSKSSDPMSFWAAIIQYLDEQHEKEKK